MKSQKRITIWLWPLGIGLFSLLFVCLNNWINAPTETARAILGRWQRVSPAGPGDPNELSAEYIEYRENGVLLTLIKDEGSNKFWLNNSATYTVTSSSEMQVTGSCWRGWERFSCTRTYRMLFGGDRLTITGDGPAEYQRVGGLSPNLPPALIPPFPSPTP